MPSPRRSARISVLTPWADYRASRGVGVVERDLGRPEADSRVDRLRRVRARCEEGELRSSVRRVAGRRRRHRAAEPAAARVLDNADARDLGQPVAWRRRGRDRDRLAVEQSEQRRADVAPGAPGAPGCDLLVRSFRLVARPEGAAPDRQVRPHVGRRRDDLETRWERRIGHFVGGDCHQRRAELQREPGVLERGPELGREPLHVLEAREAVALTEGRAEPVERLAEVSGGRLVGDRVVEVAQFVARVEEARERRDAHRLVEAARGFAHVGLDSLGLAHAVDYRDVMAVETRVAPELLRTQAYVDGAWVDADSGETFPVVNPATGETIAEVPRMGAAETRRAIEAAAKALP